MSMQFSEVGLLRGRSGVGWRRPGGREPGMAIRVALTGVMAWLAVVLLLPGETFGTSVSFTVMSTMASEPHWAVAFMVLGGIGTAGCATRSRALRMLCGSLVATMHGVVALCLVLANPISTGTGTYAILATLGYYLVWEQALGDR